MSARAAANLFILAALAWAAFPRQSVASDIPLGVRETAGVGRTGEIIHNGIPIGRQTNLLTTTGLQIRNGAGQPIPAQFEVLSRWGGERNGTLPIQWLLATFPADVAASGTTTYILGTGPNTSPATSLVIAQTPQNLTVNTGVAEFVIGKTAFSVLEKASLISGQTKSVIVDSPDGSARIDVAGQGTMTALSPDEITVEHQGPLFATVKVSGRFDHSPTGGAALRYVARYDFRAGSAAFQLDYYFAWPGSLAGDTVNSLSDAGIFNGGDPRAGCLLIYRSEITFPLALTQPFRGYASATSQLATSGPLTATTTASLSQQRRPAMTAPAICQIAAGDRAATESYATHPYVAAIGTAGGIGAGIQKMALYEPQSIAATPGRMTVRVVSEPQWLAPFMGGFARLGFSLIPAGGSPAQERDRACAALDHPLIAWPDASHVANSLCFGELWDGTPNTTATAFLSIFDRLSRFTFESYTNYGMHGFMTYGLAPRYWDTSWHEFGDETDKWDGYFFGGTFTDYHHVFSCVTRQFAMTGDASLLHDLAFPAARRMLDTQIIQVNPGSTSMYGGWAPYGYGAYRFDGNSSHSYFENLFFYYYLTGDRQVVETLMSGALAKRPIFTRTGGGALIPPDQPSPQEVCSGRFASQTADIWWFLGHASDDATFLDDFRNVYDRFVSRHTALLQANGNEYAFIALEDVAANPHTMDTEQCWLLGQYNLNDVWRIYLDYGDIGLGAERIPISRLYKAFYRTLWDYHATVHEGGDGRASGVWSNYVTVNWTGALKGGTITSVLPASQGETFLWTTTKGFIPAITLRAGRLSGDDPVMRARGRGMYGFLMDGFDPTGRTWDKTTGLQFFLAPAALSYMANSPRQATSATDGKLWTLWD